MKRRNLAEIEDWPQLPAWLRDAITGYLRAAISLSNPYAAVVPILAELVRESGRNQIVDLASGGGGPWPGLVEKLKSLLGQRPRVILTDIQPNLSAAAELEDLPGVTYRRDPVSALEIPPDLEGVRTIFTGLHHFDEAGVRSILRAAQETRVPFLAAEATHRSWRGILTTLFVPLLVLFLMPRVRPRRLLPLVLTYLPPIMPLLIWWDGFASTMRTYRADELRSFILDIQDPGYSWRVEELSIPGAPIPVTIIVGRPVEN